MPEMDGSWIREAARWAPGPDDPGDFWRMPDEETQGGEMICANCRKEICAECLNCTGCDLDGCEVCS